MIVIQDANDTIVEDIEKAEKNIRKAFTHKIKHPDLAKAFYNHSIYDLEKIKPIHDNIVAFIKEYREKNGEPPAPMMAIYDYEHRKQIERINEIKRLQEMYNSGL